MHARMHTLAADHIRGGPFLPKSTGLWINILFWIKCFPYLLFFPSRLQVELVWNQKSYVHSFEWKSGLRGTLRKGKENSLSERELVTTFVQILQLPQILRYTSNKGCAVLSRSGLFPLANLTALLPRNSPQHQEVCVCVRVRSVEVPLLALNPIQLVQEAQGCSECVPLMQYHFEWRWKVTAEQQLRPPWGLNWRLHRPRVMMVESCTVMQLSPNYCQSLSPYHGVACSLERANGWGVDVRWGIPGCPRITPVAMVISYEL